MFKAVDNPYLVPFDGSFKYKHAVTSNEGKQLDDKEYKKKLNKQTDKIHDLQRIMYAHDSHSMLLVFQAMDAAGKDSTIRHVLTGVNPAGCQVFSFKKPSDNELDHDYLWRTTTRLPERGRIGVFNRSYYEEVLVVRVHPEILNYQKLPDKPDQKEIWKQRYESIRNFEQHLARNGTVILKFWLNVSKQEQCNRFLSRIDEPEKNWKFSEADIEERGHWDDYMQAYEKALIETSRSWAPWYSIPADNKPYMRYTVAKIIAETMASLNMHYPKVDEEAKQRFAHLREMLVNDK
ncbi:MAG: polyphosphate kinase 2 family protein [Gammaproteobacteria bacterium]|nr:polyphosphate kinase 2 family protein [Gammaproteobacteria bacterium]